MKIKSEKRRIKRKNERANASKEAAARFLKDIDAETYSIHGLAGETTKLNGKETTESNSFSYSKIDPENKSEAEKSTVETSPLIPEWANQTENPAFFQNLDIPTFLRRRGSNRPRQ